MTGSNVRLRFEGLAFGYNGRPHTPPLDMTIGSGDLWAVIGPNGAGKTTFLRTILRLHQPVSGTVEWLEGVTVGYIPQRTAVDMSVPARVIDVVRGGVDHGWSFLVPGYTIRYRQSVRRALADAHVLDLSNHRFSELSEGQKQRVLMARALASNPTVMVLDEPTTAMDVSSERSVFDLISRMRKERQLAVLLVSHNLSLAREFATHILFVDKDRDVVKQGTTTEMAYSDVIVERYGKLLQPLVEATGEVAP